MDDGEEMAAETEPDVRGAVLREPAHRVSPQAVPFWRVSALIGDVVLVVAVVVAYVVIPDVPGWTLLLVLLVEAAAGAHVVLMHQIHDRVRRRADHGRLPRRRHGPRGRGAADRDHRRDDRPGRRDVIPSPGTPGEGWSRLSPRKLLLDPVKAIGQAIVPVVVALVGISQSDSG